jgi:hypothetical protein
VEKDFAPQLKSGEMAWKILNYEESAVATLAKKFEIQMPVVVLAKIEGERVEDWKRLDKVWALVGDKTAFAKYVHDEIEAMLSATQAASESSKSEPPAIPVPESSSQDIPVPEPSGGIPVPQDN